MTNLLKAFLLPAIIASFLLFFSTSAAALNILEPGCKQAPNSPVCLQAAQQGTKDPVAHTLNTAANIIAAIGGIVAVVMIIFSGLRFITAGGATPGQRSSDPNKVKTARATLTAAIVGLIVIALAWAITRFITTRVIQ